MSICLYDQKRKMKYVVSKKPEAAAIVKKPAGGKGFFVMRREMTMAMMQKMAPPKVVSHVKASLSRHFLPEIFQRMWRIQEMKMRMKTVMEQTNGGWLELFCVKNFHHVFKKRKTYIH